MKCFAIHGPDLSVKDGWELTPDVGGKSWLVGGGGSNVRGGGWYWIGVMLGKDGQSLSGLPGQQCPSNVGVDVEVISMHMRPKGERFREFPNGAHGGSIDGLRDDC